jgi:hypothetical protein
VHQQAVRWALVGLAVHVLVTGLLLLHFEGRPEYFVHLGSERTPVELARRELGPDVLVPHRDGHDGRFFWVLARDPLLLRPAEVAANLDRPGYRSQRIAYPLLAAPWRLGGERALLWGLLLTNLAAVSLGGYAAARLAIRLGAAPRAGLAFALNPGILIAVLLDAADGLAAAALVATVLLTLERRRGWALAAAVVAVLAKEPTWLGVAGLAALAPGLERRERVLLAAVPVAAAAAWAVYARGRLGWAGDRPHELGLPLVGYVRALPVWNRAGDWSHAVAGAFAVLPLAALVVVRWWRRRTAALAAALPFALLVPLLSGAVLYSEINVLRAFAPALTLLVLDVLAAEHERDTGPRATVVPA